MIASVFSEKTRLKKSMIIIIMNKSQETTVFSSRQKLDETEARKVMVEFDALYG